MSEEDFVLSFSLLPPPAPNPTYSTRRLSTVPNSTPPSVPHTAIQGLQAPCSLRSTHFLDLDDDVFGLIHASLDPDRQAALRSTCRALHRSPAVNAQICSLTLKMPYNCRLLSDDEIDQSEASELFEPDEPREVVEVWDVADAALSWVNKIAAFPRFANLSSLLIDGKDVLEEDYLEELLLHVSWIPAARARLRTVTNLELKFARLDWGSTTTLLKLFPALESHGRLALSNCTVYDHFFLCLSSSLQNLFLRSIVLLKSPKVLSEGQESSEGSFGDTPMDVSPGIPVGMLSQLRSLSLECMVFKGAVDLGCLRGLQHLHCFSIHFCNVINLDIMLQHVPLYKLSLDDLCSPSSICFASSTLRVLELHQLEIWNFKLSLEQVPSIQCVSFTGIMFKERSGDFHDEHLAALALSRFPLTIPATFVIDFEIGWSAEQQVAALLALLPLKPDLSLHVNELLLGPWVLNLPSIQALSGLFGSVGTLNLCFHHIRSRQGAMLDILQGMPSVLCVRVAMMNALPDPLWWVAVFQSVHQARRGLVLKFGNWNRPYTWPITRGQHTAIREVFRAWQESQRALSGPPTIWLGVDREEG